jgi:hypothetical protein
MSWFQLGMFVLGWAIGIGISMPTIVAAVKVHAQRRERRRQQLWKLPPHVSFWESPEVQLLRSLTAEDVAWLSDHGWLPARNERASRESLT